MGNEDSERPGSGQAAICKVMPTRAVRQVGFLPHSGALLPADWRNKKPLIIARRKSVNPTGGVALILLTCNVRRERWQRGRP